MNFTLSENKTILITGAARRIGAYFARQLHQLGFQIVIHYRGSAQDAVKLAKELNQSKKDSAITLQADLAQFDSYSMLIEKTIDAFGRLDVLVNNASSFYPTPMGSVSEQHWHDLMSSNLKAPFFLSQAAMPWLKKTRGCIVNMVDIHAQKPLYQYPVYSAAKAGLKTLTQSLAKELAPDIRVNGIAPGSIMWPEGDAAISEQQKQKVLKGIPLGYQGEPSDLFNALRFLIHPDSRYITGQIIAVDGGRSLS